MALPVSFRWDEELVARIDEARGLVPRSAFVRACVEQALAGEGKTWIGSGATEQALSGEPSGATPSAERVPGTLPRARSAAPAEQPRHIPSSEATPANIAAAPPGVGVQLSARQTEQAREIQRRAAATFVDIDEDTAARMVLANASSSQSKRDVRPIPKGGK